MNDEILSFYRTQSAITRPGEYAALFSDLPQDVAELCRIVRGLVMHYATGDLYGCQISEVRAREMDTRYVERMLERILAQDPRPLSAARAPEDRLVGCCRDFSTLLCSLLRSQGVPARVRLGFAGYIRVAPDFAVDHVVVEYWRADEARWRMLDPQMDALLIQTNGIDFDVQDMPPGRFLTGGEAWRLCRAGQADPDNFGIDPAEYQIRGWTLIRDKLVQDLAALNKVEMLCWDAWGMLRKRTISDEDARLLDSIADLTLNNTASFAQLQRCFAQEQRVHLDGSVYASSPAVGRHKVALAL